MSDIDLDADDGPDGLDAKHAPDFTARLGHAPTHRVRAPGRVNLIGEHIDYHDLAVMPFAIEPSIRLWFAPSREDGPSVRIATTMADLTQPHSAGREPHSVERATRFAPDAFRLDHDIPLRAGGDWRNYVRAAARAFVEQYRRRDAALAARPVGPANVGHLIGIDALVTSDLPVAAGLSSSSALSVAVTLALATANGFDIDRLAMAEQVARAERLTGTEGGGMDQAVCLLARDGHVCVVEFGPLAVRHVPFPSDLRIIVAHTGSPAEKSGRMQAEYNERRRTGVRALRIVAQTLGSPDASYANLIDGFAETALLDAAATHLDAHALSRFRHVVTEANRVPRAVAALEHGDHAQLGALLSASHRSLRDDYGVSTPELDTLVERAERTGALGARLTGAGFGGAIIALCSIDSHEAVAEALATATCRPTAAHPWEPAVLHVWPSCGAAIVAL